MDFFQIKTNLLQNADPVLEFLVGLVSLDQIGTGLEQLLVQIVLLHRLHQAQQTGCFRALKIKRKN